MAQNYTRQSSFADGDTITAALFNNEFNQVVNAFAYSASSDSSTGHKHDGTSGQGGNIPQIGDIDFLNKIVVDNTNNRWGFYVQVSSGTVEQLRIQDGAIVPVTNNDIDLGTSSLEFKDLFLDGTAHIDTLDVDVNATVAGTLGVTGATTLSSTLGVTGATTLSSTLGVTGAITGSSTLQATTITATTAFVPDASDGASLGTTSLEFSDLFLADGALIAFGNDQDVTITHLADAGLLLNGARGLFFNDTTQYINAPNGTTLDIAATDEIELNATTIDINGAADVSGNLAVGGNLTVTGNATIAGNLTFGDAATDTVAFSADVASNLLPSVDNTYDLGASGSEWKDLFIDGTANIDSLVADTADINGGTIDGVTIGGSSAGDITYANLSDGTITITAFADEDDMSSDSATLVPTQQSVKAYVDAQVTAQDLDIVGDTGTDAIDLDSETITFAGGTGITSVVTTGTVTHNIDSTVATLTGSQTLTNKSLTAPTLTGTAIVASLDISGDIDVDGTANLDVVDIDGAVDMASTLGVTGVATLASLVATTADINAGTIDNTVIGGTTAAAISGTTGQFATSLNVDGTVTADGLTVDGAALVRSGNTLTLNRTDNAVGGAMSYVAGTGFIFNDVNGDGTSFNEGATNRLRIDSSGNLLSGTTTSKGSRVQAAGAAASASPTLGSATDTSLLLTNSDITYGMNFGVINNGNGWIQQHSNTGTAAAYNLLLQPVGGNVGIGVTPASKLHIGLTSSAAAVVNVGSFGAAGAVSLGSIANNNEHVYLGTGDANGAGIAAGIGFLRESSGWNSALAFYTNNVTSGPNGVSAIQEKMRIDAGGSLLIGKTTPADLHNIWNHIIIGEKGAIISENGAGGIDGITLADNAYIDADTGTYAYQTTAAASQITQSGGAITFSNAASGSAGAALTPVQTMAINPDRKVDVGGVANQTVAVLNARFNGAAIEFGHGNNTAGYYGTAGSYGNNGQPYIGFSCYSQENLNLFTTNGNKGNIITGDLSGNLTFAQITTATGTELSPTNRMMLDASGNLLVGTTSVTGSGASEGKQVIQFAGAGENGLYLDDTRTSSGTDIAIVFGRGSTYCGKIETTTAPATNYISASDQRLKENIADADDAGSKIDAIQVRKYDWIGDGSHQDYGLVAQELQPIAPLAVSGDADSDEMMGVDYSKLVPMMLKEIQSLRARVAQLES
jgi:hypothetical protein